MADTRKKNANWKLHTNGDGTTPTADAQLAVLMDIRDELQEANRSLWRIRSIVECVNARRGFIAMHKMRKHLEVALPVKASKRRKKPRAVVIRRRKVRKK